ncbi:hypothetical protein Dehly_0469 [Dehalogenimonas lykanthroporepellens BL-DC-9]|nr:hypothetical protein Dehly_0469 [Dehalogenimonas lykanthroporepellens BL-DC-9]
MKSLLTRRTAGFFLAVASIDEISIFQLALPGPDSDFYNLDLTGDTSDELDQAEGK